MNLIGIFDAGGYAREVMPIARHSVKEEFGEEEWELVFVVPEIGGNQDINGHRVIPEADFFSAKSTKYFNVAIADSRLRRRIVDNAIYKGAKPLALRAHNIVTLDSNQIGEGTILSPSVIIHNYAYIGTGAILKHGTSSKPLVIGEGAVVGMGAVVTKNVEPGAVIVGNPARPLQQ